MSFESPRAAEHEVAPRDDLELSEGVLLGLASLGDIEPVELGDGSKLDVQIESLGDHKLFTVALLKEVDGADYIGEMVGTIYMDPNKLEDAVIDLPNTDELKDIFMNLSGSNQQK